MAEPTSTSSPAPEPSQLPHRPNTTTHTQTQTQTPLALTSPQTALALLPPRHLWPSLDRLRAFYDKAYPAWPPHVNVVYPFVRTTELEEAVARVAGVLQASSPAASHPAASGVSEGAAVEVEDGSESGKSLNISLNNVAVFERPGKGRENTLYLHDQQQNNDSNSSLAQLRRLILSALGNDIPSSQHNTKGEKQYRMHLSMGQTDDATSDAHRFLVDKIGLVPRVEWCATELAVLVREQDGKGGSVMRLWGTVGLDGGVSRFKESVFYLVAAGVAPGEEKEADEAEAEAEAESPAAAKDTLQTRPVYHTTPSPTSNNNNGNGNGNRNKTLTIASYNVLAEFHHPPSSTRHPLLLDTILSSDSDILLLQEVTDAFLSFLLSDPRIRTRYPFVSHGPPADPTTEPLPSYLNVVVLSAVEFEWEYVSLWRRHKGAIVARVNLSNEEKKSVVIAAIHLSQGLTDGAVTVKRADLKRLVGYLRATYPGQPWVLAGDFNVSTSSVSIGAAVKKGTLSEVSRGYLAGLERWLVDGEEEGGFVDAWECSLEASRESDEEEDGDGEIVAGEKGATWDPTRNALAAAMAAAGGNVRPQRYDRILVRGEGVLEVEGFNMFGFRTGVDEKGEPMYASDHWGVRCTLGLKMGEQEKAEAEEETEEETEDETEEEEKEKEELSDKIARLIIPVHLQRAPSPLAHPGSLHNALVSANVIPTPADYTNRQKALDFLRRVLLDSDSQAKGETAENTRGQPTVVVVPVGSYALDVWTPTSDMDVLCIGPFSTRTFFALASQRIRRAASSSLKKNNPDNEKESDTIHILRRVRANHGTMLELQVNHIKMDLQYCPATTVAERWPAVLTTPPSDPVWSLSAPTLSKLKAARDADYLLRSVPDKTVFRAAHRFLKTWAVARGVYAARFGFLSGIQLAILLVRVYKLVSQDETKAKEKAISAEDLVTTFFHHYATFDWATQLAFDPLFHRQRLPYTRVPSREPMAVLGYFPPALNTAQAASIPSVRTLATELQHARDTLSPSPSSPSPGLESGPGPGPESWTTLLTPTTTFLTTHKSYIRLDAQYWGLPPTRGARFLGWLESRCVGLLVDMHRRAPGVHARMWPGRFIFSEPSPPQENPEDEGDDGEGDDTEGGNSRDFRGCYLIGLDKADPEKTSREELQLALGALQTVLARFEAQMRGDEKYFDAGHCWVGASVVSRAELGGLELDSREMGGYTAGEEEEDDDDEEEEEVAAAGQESGEDTDTPKPKTNKNKKNKPQKETPIDLRADKTRKFRTAADALHRIRWDPHLDRTDYLVGYEDRFLGAQEKDLEGWKTEQTDEEFIPQHRILYFRRKSDGRVVWDRRTRWDELFGNV